MRVTPLVRDRKQRRGRRRAVWIGVGLVASLALSACGGESSASNSFEGPTSVPMPTTVVAEERQVPVTLSLDGTLAADEESQVTSVVSGRVMEVLVERGTTVAEGDPLVRLRDVDFRLNARAARAAVDQAQARLGMGSGGSIPRPEDTPEVRAAQTQLELAESNLRRSEELAQRGALAQQALDEARARAASARDQLATAQNGVRAQIASLSSARAQLSQASTSVNESVVRAPFAGEIATRDVSVGEFVSPQVPLVTLVRANPLRLEMQVPQQSLMDVRAGQEVSVRVDAVPDRTFTGTIRYVSAAVNTTSRGLTVEAIVPNDDNVLRPGLFVTARISTGRNQAAAVIPSSAVLTAAGVSRVFVVSDGRIEERVIAIADRDDEHVVVSDGVRPGEAVATSDLETLADGLTVDGAPAPTTETPAQAARE
ncbi:MAG: efflux RND transporter periplasmic adaptor subunit [Sandaracinaceae bacterium]